MSHKIFIISVTLLLSVMMVLGEHLVQPGPPDFCIKDSTRQNDKYHKDVPSPEMGDLRNCSAWQNLSCCTQTLAEDLSRNPTMDIYNWSYSVCGDISNKCAEFMKNGNCNYWCEPMLGWFLTGINLNQIQGVPVCADYCDSWFEACKNDSTCYDDFEVAYYNAAGMPNRCPVDTPCRKFSAIFADGKELCNRMWGSSYIYSTDSDNCTVMNFDNRMPNPNFRLTFPSSGSLSMDSNMIQISTKLVYLLLIMAAIN